MAAITAGSHQLKWDGVNIAWESGQMDAEEQTNSGPREPGAPSDWKGSVADLRSRVQRELAAEKSRHSWQTAQTARKLAAMHGVDVERAELAGLLHDIADDHSDDQLLSLADRFQISISPTEAYVPKLLHGPVGAELLHREWGVEDEEILDAVRDHVTGGQSRLGKILFLADKLDAGGDRADEGEPIRELAMKSLDEAVLRLYAKRIDGLVADDKLIDERFVSARNQLLQHRV